MARPSLKAEKTELILQAYERCIALYGVEGATLQKVAEEAGMARPLLRHYVGNQNDLLKQSIERYFKRQYASIEGLTEIKSVETLLHVLFDKSYFEQSQKQSQDSVIANDIMISSAFTLAAQQYPEIKDAMQAWFRQFRKDFQALLKKLFPNADTQAIKTVSTGVISIYFNLYAMQPVEASDEFLTQSLQAATTLLNSLANTNTLAEEA